MRSPEPLSLRCDVLLLWLMFAALVAGCVRVYQPLSGLHRPVVVDPTLPNFEDVRLTVRCIPGDLLTPQAAGMLCQKVGALFENQGAKVLIADTTYGEAVDTGINRAQTEPEEGEGSADEPSTALTLELRARQIHEARHLLSWLLCFGTFTALPGVTESTFAQDVAIRDATGSLLLSESLEGRIVERFGAGSWLGNKLLDMTTRDDADKLTGDAINRDLSDDLYRQLSQLLFNAKMRAEVLVQAPSPQRAK